MHDENWPDEKMSGWKSVGGRKIEDENPPNEKWSSNPAWGIDANFGLELNLMNLS